MDQTGARAACELLWQHWQQGIRLDALPRSLRPETRAEGYLIQGYLETKSARPLWGWKVAATSAAGQRHIGVHGPLAGRLLSEMILSAETPVPLAGNGMRVAEPEFVFLMGDDLGPRVGLYTQTEVMAAVDALHLGIEVPDSRYLDFASAGGPQLIADDACANLFVLGPPGPTSWRTLDLAAHRVICTVLDCYESEGIGANVLGDPRAALTWLVNELARMGVTLRAGQYVTTGTCAVPLEIVPGSVVIADYGVLGRMSISFAV